MKGKKFIRKMTAMAVTLALTVMFGAASASAEPINAPTGPSIQYLVGSTPTPIPGLHATNGTNTLPNQPKDGDGLTLRADVTAQPPSSTLRYQWFSATSATAAGTAISTGGTAQNFVVPTTANGAVFYYCEIRAISGTDEDTLSPAARTQRVRIAVTDALTAGVPNITGNLLMAGTLTANTNDTFTSTGTVPINGATTWRYQWERLENATALSGTNLGTARNYKPVADDVGKFLRVTMTNTSQAGSLTSAVVGPIERPQLKPAAPTRNNDTTQNTIVLNVPAAAAATVNGGKFQYVLMRTGVLPSVDGVFVDHTDTAIGAGKPTRTIWTDAEAVTAASKVTLSNAYVRRGDVKVWITAGGLIDANQNPTPEQVTVNNVRQVPVYDRVTLSPNTAYFAFTRLNGVAGAFAASPTSAARTVSTATIELDKSPANTHDTEKLFTINVPVEGIAVGSTLSVGVNSATTARTAFGLPAGNVNLANAASVAAKLPFTYMIGAPRYAWFTQEVGKDPVQVGKAATFKVRAADIGKTIFVRVSFTGCRGFIESERIDGLAKPATPVLSKYAIVNGTAVDGVRPQLLRLTFGPVKSGTFAYSVGTVSQSVTGNVLDIPVTGVADTTDVKVRVTVNGVPSEELTIRLVRN